VKTRVGFDSPVGFDELLRLFAKHAVDLVTVHARTVTQGYRLPVRYDLIAQAARDLPCPVLANGHIHSAAQARDVLRQTGARGLMIGRGAVRNPWLFRQIRDHGRGRPPTLPTGREVLDYIHTLYEAQATPGAREAAQVERLKKFLNFIGEGVEPTGRFLHDIRRVRTRADFFRVCAEHLDHERPLLLEPGVADGVTAPAGRS
jgi:tRNA-dihydrouridine synthase